MSTEKRLLIDCETNGLLDTVSKVHCIVAKDIDTGANYKWTSRDKNIEEGLQFILTYAIVLGHNIIAYDLPVFSKVYPWFDFKGKTVDTLVWAKFAYGNIVDLDFEAIRRGKLKEETFKNFQKSTGKYVSAVGSHSLAAWGMRLGCLKGDFGDSTDWEEFSEDMLQYCAQDVEVNFKLYYKLFLKTLGETADWDKIEDALELEMKVAKLIFEQEQRGWCFDVPKAQDLYAQLCQRRSELLLELQQMFPGWYTDTKTPEYYEVNINDHKYRESSKGALEDFVYSLYKNSYTEPKVTRKWLKENIEEGPIRQKHTPFNPGSRHHIARVLKDNHRWIPKEFTDTGEPKIDDTILGNLEYPEAKLLSEYFTVEKRIGQIAEGPQSWLGAVRDTGRIHGRCNTLGAVTGRATHQHPNLAQVPAGKKPYGHECRDLFTVRKGYVMVGTDAEGQELRCLAHYMQKYDGGKFGRAVVEGDKDLGTDVHTMNMKAAGLANRDQAKTFIYGFVYGAGDAKIGLITLPKGTEEQQKKQGKKLKNQFLKATPALKLLREEVIKFAEDHGYIVALDGRKLPIRSSHAVLNTLLQGAGAIITKRWMAIIASLVEERGLKDYVGQLGWIHDELQFEVKEGYEQQLADICREAMVLTEKYYDFKCPLAAGTKIGRTWNDTH